MRKRKPLQAIKEFCLQCMCGDWNEVKKCTDQDCPLYEFRFGKNPYLKREISDEERDRLKERLARARDKQAGA